MVSASLCQRFDDRYCRAMDIRGVMNEVEER